VELARKLAGKAIVVADGDRVAAAAWARDEFGVTGFVLDDGFQHRRAKRDLDIVCIDATNPFGKGMMLPAGALREPLENLSRADAFVITRANLVESVDAIVETLRRWNPHAPILTSQSLINNLQLLNNFEAPAVTDRAPTVDWSALRATGEFNGDDEVRVLAFCALGNPEAFLIQLLEVFDDEAMNDEFHLAVIKKFPDHHRYTQSDIDSLQKQARDGKEVHAFVTTAKDAVKLRGLRFEVPCFVAEIEISIDDPTGFRDLILST